MARYAIINSKTSKVVNVCEWDGVSQWSPPTDHYIVQSETAAKGHIYNPNTQTLSEDFSEKKLIG